MWERRGQGLVEVPKLMDPVEEKLGQGVVAISILQGPCGGEAGLPSAGGTGAGTGVWGPQ